MVNDGKENRENNEHVNIQTSTPNDGSRVARRSFLKATGAGAGAAALAGCTDQLSGGGGGGGIPDTIKIGALGPADSPMGKSILNTAKLAAKEINNNGGVEGSDIKVITKDTKDDPATTRQAYQELTTGKNVNATMGIFGSENLLAVMGNIAQAETVHVTAGAATPEAPRRVKENYDKYKYWFRAGPVNSIFLGRSLVQFAEDQFDKMGWNRVAFLAEDYKWTEPVTKVIRQQLPETGVEVTSVKRISEGTEDFTPIYDELENSNVDGAYTSLAHIGTTSLVQWAKQQRDFGYGGIHVPTQLPTFYKATNGAAIATFSQTTAVPTARLTDKTKPYADAYKQAYGGFPVYTGYTAMDTMYMLKRAIEGAGSVNSDDLVDELEQMKYTGTAGTIAFYGRDKRFPHDVKYGPEFTRGVYFQWQKENDKGVQKVIWPKKYDQADYVKPPWVSR